MKHGSNKKNGQTESQRGSKSYVCFRQSACRLPIGKPTWRSNSKRYTNDVRTKCVVLRCAISCCIVLCAVFSCHVALFCVLYLYHAVNVIYKLPVYQNLPETPSARSPSRPPKSPTPKPQVGLLNSTLYPYIKILNKNTGWTLNKIKLNLVRDYETPCKMEWNITVIYYGPCWYKKTFTKPFALPGVWNSKKKIIYFVPFSATFPTILLPLIETKVKKKTNTVTSTPRILSIFNSFLHQTAESSCNLCNLARSANTIQKTSLLYQRNRQQLFVSMCVIKAIYWRAQIFKAETNRSIFQQQL
jgi:hypothetical protein